VLFKFCLRVPITPLLLDVLMLSITLELALGGRSVLSVMLATMNAAAARRVIKGTGCWHSSKNCALDHSPGNAHLYRSGLAACAGSQDGFPRVQPQHIIHSET